jgi:Sulfotransferase family
MRILLAGVPRSGTTWAANVLGRAAGLHSVYEPDGPYSDILGALLATRLGEYPAIGAFETDHWYRMVWNLAFAGGWPWERSPSARAAGRQMVKLPPQLRDYAVAALAAAVVTVRRRPNHVLVKSVNSALSLEWVARTYSPKVVVLRRNPLNVISSWVVIGWKQQRSLEDLPVVRERFIRPLGLTPPKAQASLLSKSAFQVGLLMTALKLACEQHPDWIVESHDALARDPRRGFASLYARLGLEWNPAVDTYLALSDQPGFVVYGRNARSHPNAVTATDPVDRRRESQATQYRRRLTTAQVQEVESVLDGFPLDEWRA